MVYRNTGVRSLATLPPCNSWVCSVCWPECTSQLSQLFPVNMTKEIGLLSSFSQYVLQYCCLFSFPFPLFFLLECWFGRVRVTSTTKLIAFIPMLFLYYLLLYSIIYSLQIFIDNTLLIQLGHFPQGNAFNHLCNWKLNKDKKTDKDHREQSRS